MYKKIIYKIFFITFIKLKCNKVKSNKPIKILYDKYNINIYYIFYKKEFKNDIIFFHLLINIYRIVKNNT